MWGLNMKLCSAAFKQAQHPVNLQVGLNMAPFFPWKERVVFVMGATGTGKSRLAIDLATRLPAEIVNSDKIQVHKGLDVLTNKITEEECRGVPHHLLGVIDPDSNFTAADFRHQASLAVESILDRGRHPIIAGGSNSYIEAFVNDEAEFRRRYESCFLWVDVSLPVLHSFVSERVDKMVGAGLIDEARQIFDPNIDYSQGIRRAIGLAEMDLYLRSESSVDEETRVKLLEEAIEKIKINTCTLACRQLRKIHRLYDQWKWKMHRIDATEVFLKRGEEADEAWDRLVAAPSTMIVEEFLYKDRRDSLVSSDAAATSVIAASAGSSVPIPAVAAATR